MNWSSSLFPCISLILVRGAEKLAQIKVIFEVAFIFSTNFIPLGGEFQVLTIYLTDWWYFYSAPLWCPWHIFHKVYTMLLCPNQLLIHTVSSRCSCNLYALNKWQLHSVSCLGEILEVILDTSPLANYISSTFNI